MRPNRLLVLLVTAGLLLASIPGAAVVGATADQGGVHAQVEGEATDAPTENGTENGTEADSTNESTNDSAAESGNGSQASTGQQLATVIAVTDDEVSGDVSSASFEAALEDANESERAATLADRAADLRERADEVATERENATAAFEAGDLSRTEYAQRLAVLASRANTIDNSFERLDDHAEDVSALELRAAGYDRSANEDAREGLGRLTSAGASALLAQYTGESSGEFELETENGLSIEVESEDGEHSRELERPQPGNGSFVMSASEAQDAARGALADPGDAEGEWTLRSMERDDDGYYEFGFAFVGANATGEAEVSVDGETGEVFELEEEIEPREDDEDEEDGDADDERDDDTDDRPLSVSLVDGTPEAGAEVTLRVTADGEPVEGAAVEFNDQSVGSTDADGLLTVTLPDDDEVDVEVEAGEREGELELSLREVSDEERENAEISERLSVDGSLDNGTATLRVTYDGEGVANATAYVDDERVGATDEDGSLSFETSETDELEVTLVKGSFEAELEFDVGDDGSLTVSDVDVEDREEDEDEREDDERDEDDEREEDDAEEEAESDGDDDGDEEEDEVDDDDDDDDDEEDDEADEEDDE
ncbi:DUF7096 domain-containing protein [Haloparvum sedimenti]|uniref:DUF7096 domain-containing protein n=1 Tax=Haloparvum sedimenti TaxID=1678448 RepID=UPI00071E69B8|nr:hypothetical protein [Haloparvum sedimenti]